MVVGSKSSGKNTLCKILLNYSAVYGWNPIYVDLDPDQQGRDYPGCIRAEIFSAQREDKIMPKLSYFYGYNCKYPLQTLYRCVDEGKLAQIVLLPAG